MSIGGPDDADFGHRHVHDAIEATRQALGIGDDTMRQTLANFNDLDPKNLVIAANM